MGSSRQHVAVPGATMIDALRLAALGTATYLSYWSLFFALCRAGVRSPAEIRDR